MTRVCRSGPRQVFKMAFEMPPRNRAIHAPHAARYCESGGRTSASPCRLLRMQLAGRYAKPKASLCTKQKAAPGFRRFKLLVRVLWAALITKKRGLQCRTAGANLQEAFSDSARSAPKVSRPLATAKP